jgi:hypothetical protein
MRKKLYDFSLSNAIVVLLAYAILMVFSIYFIFDNEGTDWVATITTILLALSLGLVVWYYVFLAVIITDEGIYHGKKFISKKDLKWRTEYNRRFRYYEIIFYDKYINYEQLSAKERKKKEIVLQYFPKYERLLKDYFQNI